jgi:hypothetical protein
MTDEANTENLGLFRESLLAALDTNVLTKLNQVFQSLATNANGVRSGTVPEKRGRANTAYYNFVTETQMQRMRSRWSCQAFADACLREVLQYAERNTLTDVTSAKCKSTGMKLYFKFHQWQQSARRAS